MKKYILVAVLMIFAVACTRYQLKQDQLNNLANGLGKAGIQFYIMNEIEKDPEIAQTFVKYVAVVETMVDNGDPKDMIQTYVTAEINKSSNPPSRKLLYMSISNIAFGAVEKVEEQGTGLSEQEIMKEIISWIKEALTLSGIEIA